MTNDYGNLELHQVLLAAMKDIDKICRENGLRYYLHAGTLLGALNHKGFIPWDDDVDISLFRQDYEKLVSLIRTEYSDKFFLQNYHTDPEYKNNRSVLRVLGTKVIHYHEGEQDKHCEIGVDLVPLDGVPDLYVFRKLQQWGIWIFDVAVQIKQGDIIPHHPVMKCIGLLSKISRDKLGRIIDRIAMVCNSHETKYVGLLTYTGKNPYTGRSGYENDLMSREWFLDPIMVEFEDTQFMTISSPVDDLVHRYGPNWAEPYPEEKRITKHDVKTYEISPEVRERFGL